MEYYRNGGILQTVLRKMLGNIPLQKRLTPLAIVAERLHLVPACERIHLAEQFRFMVMVTRLAPFP